MPGKIHPEILRGKASDSVFELATFTARDIHAAVLRLKMYVHKNTFNTQEGGYGSDVVDADMVLDAIDRSFYDVTEMRDVSLKKQMKKTEKLKK